MVVASAVLLAAGAAGFAIGHANATPIGTADGQEVSTSFVTVHLAPGWSVKKTTSTQIEFGWGTNGAMWIDQGNASQRGVSSVDDLFRQQLNEIAHNSLDSSVGTCLPETRATIGGVPGEEVGFLFREKAATGQTVFRNCQLYWGAVHGGAYYTWNSFDTVDQLGQLRADTVAMQRSAVWKRS